ncbi:hypothetical protein EYF80_007845 [Liparis tanakae]|uniref:Uncharacterized protein n=1 Tax=Liparis tanakae TaxID=230148 RepID=A0A4Z2IW15_9TELE|nr:hypothetical protein EYF80_007845 [Liparis tanakae]
MQLAVSVCPLVEQVHTCSSAEASSPAAEQSHVFLRSPEGTGVQVLVQHGKGLLDVLLGLLCGLDRPRQKNDYE